MSAIIASLAYFADIRFVLLCGLGSIAGEPAADGSRRGVGVFNLGTGNGSSVLDVIRLDYVTTARSKGIGERKVITRHVVRTALIPVVTLVALQMPIVFSGAIVTEQIFRVPGIGSLLITSMLSNDTPVVMGVTFVSACLVVIFNLIADILYGWLDPRIAFR